MISVVKIHEVPEGQVGLDLACIVRCLRAESMRHLSNPSSPLVKLLDGLEKD